MRTLLYILLLSFILHSSSGIIRAQDPFNWVIDEVNPGEDVSIRADESVFTEGLRSCHLQLKSGAVPYLYSEVFYITPGSDYEFSIDVYDNDTAGQVKIYADFYDIYGFDVYGEPPVFSKDSSTWQRITWQGKVPSQAVVGYILVKFYCQPGLYSFTRQAEVWLDNARFVQSGGENLVLNGGFEQWLVDIATDDDNIDSYLVYPNPTVGMFAVRGSQFAGERVRISLAGMTGNEMHVLFEGRMDSQEMHFDISHFPDGLYFLSIFEESGDAFTCKIILSRN